MALEGIDRCRRSDDQWRYPFVALTALLDFPQTVAKCLDQGDTTLAVGQQIVLEVRIALHHPDVPQHLVQHSCRTAGDTLGAQLVKQCPLFLAEQSYDDLTVGKRGVVVGDFAQTCVHR